MEVVSDSVDFRDEQSSALPPFTGREYFVNSNLTWYVNLWKYFLFLEDLNMKLPFMDGK